MSLELRALTFDLDDTLWAVAPVIERAEREVGRWMAMHYPAVVPYSDAVALLALRRQAMTDYPRQTHDLSFMRRKVYSELAAAAGIDNDFVEKAFKEFDYWRNRVEFYPDARPALTTLAGRCPLLAITNGNADLHKVGLGEEFAGAIYAGKVGASKPDLRVFEAALDELALPAEDVLHVGDDPIADIEGARKAGFRTAWVNRTAMSWPLELQRPDIEVTTLTELVTVLEKFD